MTEPLAPAAGRPDAAPPAEETGAWRHLHPLSPLVRGGVAVVAAVGWFLSQERDRLLGSETDDPTMGHPLWGVGAVALVALGIAAVSWVSWRFSRYRLAPTLIEMRTGLVFRQHRQVRYDRIQAVDIARPVLARLLGLAEVVVQSAGGGDSHLRLQYLTLAAADDVRARLVVLAHPEDGVRPAPVPGEAPVREEPRHPVLAVPTTRLLQAWALSGTGAFLLLAVPFVLGAVLLDRAELLAGLAPALVGVGGAKVGQLLRELNFVLERAPQTLHLRHGLTEVRSTTVPLVRVQAVELRQPLLWRPFGWWRCVVNVAGTDRSGEQAKDDVLLPVGTFAEAREVLGLAVAAVPPDLLARAGEGSGPEGGFTTTTARTRLLDPFAWRRRGYAVTDAVLVTRGGRLNRTVQVVPHARVQSVRLEQGPLERLLGIATVRVDSTPGPVGPAVRHLDVEDAQVAVDRVRALAAAARTAPAPPAY